MAKWTRVFPAFTTQFKDDERLDIAAMERHIDALIKAGIGGLTVCGSVGENYALDADEKLEIVKLAVRATAGRVPMVAGVAETTTRFCLEYMAACAREGVDGFMVLPTLVYKLSPNEVMRHFRTVARATDKNIMIYNNPPAYGGDVTPTMFRDLADEANIVALKESSTDIRRIQQIKTLCGERFTVFAGMDDIAVESVLGGARGFVAGVVNAFPAETIALFDLACAGRYDEAMAINAWLAPIVRHDNDPRFVHYMKLFTALAGHGSEKLRLPRLQLDGKDRAEAVAAFERAVATRPNLPKIARAAE